ncbi:MAG: hypothetical protein OJF49_002556 [Ktedonobacterales bacterium]|jgi:uncharacterized protein (TIRG00374 family)|nr:MAG: hypothetical protein OJF49_002556 [Ktedonobacterales bacterium]
MDQEMGGQTAYTPADGACARTCARRAPLQALSAPDGVITARKKRSRRLNGQVIRIIIGAFAAVVLVATFSRVVSLRGAFVHLEHLNIPLALLCGVVFLAAYVVRALRWRVFLKPHPVGVVQVILIYQVATFVNWLLPLRGGEIVKGLLLKRLDEIPMSDSLPTVAADKMMDLLPAVVLVIILPFLPFRLSGPLWFLLLSVLVVLCIGFTFLGLAAWRRERAFALLRIPLDRLPARMRNVVEPFMMRFIEVLLALLANPRRLIVAAGYTAVAVALDALFAFLAFQAVGVGVVFPVALFGYTLYNLGYILPTPPGQIGSNEVIGLLIFSGLFGVSAPGVAAMFLFSHPWTALLMTCSGLLCLSAMGLNLRSTLKMSMSAPPADAPASSTSTPSDAPQLQAQAPADTPRTMPAAPPSVAATAPAPVSRATPANPSPIASASPAPPAPSDAPPATYLWTWVGIGAGLAVMAVGMALRFASWQRRT